MGILVECPQCRSRAGTKRKVCKCGCPVQKAEGKNYWIEFYQEGKRIRERIGRSKLAAENRLREIQTAKAEGRYIRKNKNEKHSLGSLYSWYCTLTEIKSLASYPTLKTRLFHPVQALGETLKIAALSLDHLQSYTVSRLQAPSRWKKQECIAPATVRKEIASLKAMLNVAVRYGKIESNPIKNAALPQEDNVRKPELSHVDFKRLLDCAEDHIQPLLIMAYYEPMRKEEMVALTWNEVDLKAGFLRLEASRTKGSHSGRSIPIHPEVRKMLLALPRVLHTRRVFLRERKDGELQPFSEFRRPWNRARKEAGLEEFVFHDFRHIAISNLRKAGNSPTVIMKASGHKTMSMFLRYNLVDEEDLKGMKWNTPESEEEVLNQGI